MKLIILCILFSNSIIAGTADLEISTDLNFAEVNFLQQGEFSITIVNHGPDTSGDNPDARNPNVIGLSGLLLNEDNYFDIAIRKNENIEQDCGFGLIVTEPPETGPQVATYIYFFDYPTLSANESITCYGEYAIGFQDGTRTFSWKAGSYNFEVDPNLDNNVVEFSFRIKPRVIPMLDWFSLALMVFFMMLIAHVIFKEYRIKQNSININ